MEIPELNHTNQISPFCKVWRGRRGKKHNRTGRLQPETGGKDAERGRCREGKKQGDWGGGRGKGRPPRGEIPGRQCRGRLQAASSQVASGMQAGTPTVPSSLPGLCSSASGGTSLEASGPGGKGHRSHIHKTGGSLSGPVLEQNLVDWRSVKGLWPGLNTARGPWGRAAGTSLNREGRVGSQKCFTLGFLEEVDSGKPSCFRWGSGRAHVILHPHTCMYHTMYCIGRKKTTLIIDIRK